MSLPGPYSLTLSGGIICLFISCAIFVAGSSAQDDPFRSLSLIGHDPRLYLRAPLSQTRYMSSRAARGRAAPSYSQRILGRLSDGPRNGLSSFLPERNSDNPEGLYWMRPDAGARSQLNTVGSGPLVPRGPAGMRMLSELDAEAVAASRPLPPLWSLLQAPRNTRTPLTGVPDYNR